MKRATLGRDRFAIRDLRLQISRRDLITTTLIVAASAATAFLAKPLLGEVPGALIFVLAIMLCGALGGLASSLAAAIAAFLIYNFYFAEPVLTFRLASGSDIAPLVAFNLCAIIAGVMAGRLKDSALAANRGKDALTSLLAASQALQSAVRTSDVAAALRDTASLRPGVALELFSVREGLPYALSDREPPSEWRRLAAMSLEQTAPIVVDGELTAYRLDSSGGPIGVLLAREGGGDRPEPPLMAALANLVALAFERATLSELIADARARAKTEVLKTALLSSVSHDFRTPLTAISASASSLIDYRDHLDRSTSLRLLHGIVEECERLNRYTANLLEMSRLEAGQSPANLQRVDALEMVSAAIQRMRARVDDRLVTRRFDGENMLVWADASLFELVLVNVLDNAALYSNSGSRIEVQADTEEGFCRITIADEGRGIPDEDLGRVFERFQRVARTEPSPLGSGLGLAIAKAFVEALGGSIRAFTPGIGSVGTRIVICLPLANEGSQP